jgi:hypothetical protein
MIKRKKNSDIRFNGTCVYCGELANTQDHVPSKILLNAPFPEDLHAVDCCRKCNNGFSKDEEYFACLIECMIHATTDINKLTRDKVKRVLLNNNGLHKRLNEAMMLTDKGIMVDVDWLAVENVLLKLARGHAAYETSQPRLDTPLCFSYKMVNQMSNLEKERFFSTPEIEIYPEVGSRLFEQVILYQNNVPYSQWITVQDHSYLYLITSQSAQLSVRIIIYEYFVAEAIWEN